MAIKMPTATEMQRAQQELELKGQVDRYTQMIEAGQGTPVLWYNLGVSLLGLEAWGDARDAFDHALKLDSEMVEAHVNRGAACYQLGDFEEAVLSLQKALTLKDDFLAARANLGVSLMKLGRHRDSIREMEEVLKKVPEHPAALGSLTLCYEALGMKEEAQKYRAKASETGVIFRNQSEHSSNS